MLIKTFLERWENSLRENAFLKVLILLLAVGLIVNGQFFKKDRVVIVPPYISQPFTIAEKKVSPEYLEQMAVFLGTFATTFTPANISYNVSTLLKYVDDSAYKAVKTVLMGQKARVETEGITQSFFPQNVICYEKENVVDVIGRAVRFVQDRKIFDGREGYRLSFVYRPESGLRVREFRPLEETELKNTMLGKVIESPTAFTRP